MKKVAFLVKGAVSKRIGRYYKIDNLENNYVNIQACFNSIKHHIVDVNPDFSFDFFVVSWTQALKSQLIEIYSPKNYFFDDYLNYHNLFCDVVKKYTNDENYINLQVNQVSQSFAIKKGIEIIEQSKVEYDAVIIYRPDVMLWKDMDLSKYNLNTITINAEPDGGGEFHFIMNLQNASKFKFVYDSLLLNNCPINHATFKNYITECLHQNYVLDDIYPAIHQEIIRTMYQNVLPNKYITEEHLNFLGTSSEELYTYKVLQ